MGLNMRALICGAEQAQNVSGRVCGTRQLHHRHGEAAYMCTYSQIYAWGVPWELSTCLAPHHTFRGMRQQGITCARSEARSPQARCRAPCGPAALAAARTRPLQHWTFLLAREYTLAATHMQQTHPKSGWPLCMSLNTCSSHGQEHHPVRLRLRGQHGHRRRAAEQTLADEMHTPATQPQARTAPCAAAAAAPLQPQGAAWHSIRHHSLSGAPAGIAPPSPAVCPGGLRSSWPRCAARCRPASQHMYAWPSLPPLLPSPLAYRLSLSGAAPYVGNSSDLTSRQVRRAACMLWPRAARCAADPGMVTEALRWVLLCSRGPWRAAGLGVLNQRECLHASSPFVNQPASLYRPASLQLRLLLHTQRRPGCCTRHAAAAAHAAHSVMAGYRSYNIGRVQYRSRQPFRAVSKPNEKHAVGMEMAAHKVWLVDVVHDGRPRQQRHESHYISLGPPHPDGRAHCLPCLIGSALGR